MNIIIDEYNINGTFSSNYLFILKKIPQFVFNLKRFPIPSLTGMSAGASYINRDIKNVPDSVRYGDLTCEIFVDEKFQSYYEIYKWLMDNTLGVNGDFRDLYSDGNLLIYNNSLKKLVLDIKLVNIHPTNISEVQATNIDTEDLTFIGTFDYDYFDPTFKLIS